MTLDLLHVFLLTLGMLHAFFTSRDTWFIAWMKFGLLHVFLLIFGLLQVFLMSRDTWFIA
jgi:hypothetical protein